MEKGTDQFLFNRSLDNITKVHTNHLFGIEILKTKKMVSTMKIFVLVLALASIGQTQLIQEGKEQEEKSQLRLGYDIMYEHWGKLLHSLNVYDLIVAIDLPSFRLQKPYR